jgi:hypothetical protein
MRNWCRQLGRIALSATLLGLASFSTRAAHAQTTTYPAWMLDSDTVSNSYITLWEYWRNGMETRFNIWTQTGDPLNTGDDFYYVYRTDTNGNITLQCPWGSRLFSQERPTPCVAAANGTTTGDARPWANILTLKVEDSSATTGYTYYLYPEDGRANFGPPVIDSPNFQGFYAPYTMPSAAPTASGVDLVVNQKTQFARDLVRYEVVIKNNGGTARRVGARVLIATYVDNQGPTKSFFIPKTRERVTYEKEFRGAFIPDEWEIYDDDEGPNPVYIGKGILRGNGATSPTRVIFGNMLDMIPVFLANAQTTYDWTVRPDFELRIADMGEVIYWDPISIPAGQSRSFVTYVGVGVASHAMSDAYIATQGSVNTAQQETQGFVGAVQAPFALPLIDGDADTTEHTVTSYIQNEFAYSMPNTFAYIQLPDGLRFGDSNTAQPQQRTIGYLGSVGGGLDEGSTSWTVQATGIEAGLLPIDMTFGNNFGDSARTRRLMNVPQGRLYQFGDDWRMITFPFTYDRLENDPSVVFNLPSGSFQIVQYNPESNQYEQVSQLVPGESYWVRMLGLGDTAVRAVGANPVKLSTTDLFSTQIKNGWNQVGNPSPYVVRVRDLRFVQGSGRLIYFDAAVTAGYIRPSIYQFNRKTRKYELLGKDDVINPGRGIWIYANAERDMVWPPPQGPQLSITP